MKENAPVESAAVVLDAKDWRGKTLEKIREIFHAADPEIIEEWK